MVPCFRAPYWSLRRSRESCFPATEPDELKLFLAAPEECGSLNEYLEKFDLPLQVLQTKEAVRKASTFWSAP